MNIAIDYDGTWTRDRELWQDFAEQVKSAGHTLYCVSRRSPHDNNQDILDSVPCCIYFTNMQPKRAYMDSLGIPIHIWIDDEPEHISPDRVLHIPKDSEL